MKIVLASHGNFCHGLFESYTMIAGKNKDIHAISLDDSGIGTFRNKLNELLDELTSNDNVLILTDIKGGTPHNESYSYKLMHEGKVRLIAGMNLPMLVELGLSLSSINDLDQLAQLAVDTGKESISLEESDSEDDLGL
ncbi:PTS system fructose-specific EIIA component [bioreactor metagenome]|uniref:PTS system, mannose-specific IIA component n=2 Tax=root TaxID=1 RepID=A0AB38BG09_9LACT|nr:PTS sugar transporter subunit IIA [Trichococcus flocculiformis]CZQ87930.1 phosphotransferase system mannose-type iia component [Trichococcus flocculiformis]SFH62512.1 PTS system, mannose-specific IIA component [Trichococcus flocculiformis]